MGRSKLAYIRRLVSRIKNTGDHQIVRHFSTPAWFRNRLNPTVPALAGCMSLCSWGGDQLIYAMMSGKNIGKQKYREKYGLLTCSESHGRGGLSVIAKSIYTVIYYLLNKVIDIYLYSSRFYLHFSYFTEKMFCHKHYS